MAAYYESTFRSSDDSWKRAGIFFHDISRSDLKEGDHIYAYRAGGIYSHHGIFTGESNSEAVIHFSNRLSESSQSSEEQSPYNDFSYGFDSQLGILPGNRQIKVALRFSDPSSQTSGGRSSNFAFGLDSNIGIYNGECNEAAIHFSIANMGLSSVVTGEKSSAMIHSCSLSDFLNGSDLRLVVYDATIISKLFKRQGTTHCFESREPERVVETANFYKNNPIAWEDYHLLFNNCETFAFYCKTGLKFNPASQLSTYKPVFSQIADVAEGITDIMFKIQRWTRRVN